MLGCGICSLKAVSENKMREEEVMRTKEEWIAGLKTMRRNVYLTGEKVDRDDERMRGAINTLGERPSTTPKCPSMRSL